MLLGFSVSLFPKQLAKPPRVSQISAWKMLESKYPVTLVIALQCYALTKLNFVSIFTLHLALLYSPKPMPWFKNLIGAH